MYKSSCLAIIISLLAVSASNNLIAQITLPNDSIRNEDILWRKRVWRQIAVYEAKNAELRNDPEMPQENIFANILLKGMEKGLYKAYATTDDSSSLKTPVKDEWVYSDSLGTSGSPFLKALIKEDVNSIIVCNPATLSAPSRIYLNYFAKHLSDSIGFSLDKPKTKERKKEMLRYDTSYVNSCSYPQQVEYYCLIEDWIFDNSKGQMVVIIKAIAPAVSINDRVKPLFWLLYPDIRNYIARFNVYNGKEKRNINWSNYFESRRFSSKITRISKNYNAFEY
jgi:gliding motility associated protien GldN